MADATWKRSERESAAPLGWTRTPNTGRRSQDMGDAMFCAEHKKTKRLPKCITDAMRQAVGNAAGRVPIVIFAHTPAQGVKTERYVVLRFADFVDLHGRATAPKETD